jgi:putative hydrolase of the HAD superfamily
MTDKEQQARVVLFDLGGVLVQLNGVPTMLKWLGDRVSTEELWKMWLTSPVVRAFESGRATPEDFADQLIRDMKLPVDRDELLTEFVQWTLGLFPGALELVESVPRRYARATLCNTNERHWPRLMSDMRLADVFDHHFASHLTGKLKPDDEAFAHVIETLECAPREVVFIDDNQLNVDGARRAGMRAFRVQGVEEARQALAEAGVLEA